MQDEITELRAWLVEQFNKIHQRFETVEQKLGAVKTDVDALVFAHSREFFQAYKKGIGLSSPEKQVLLTKFEDGTITYNEALRLREILEREKVEAFARGAFAALAIVGLLALLGVIIESLRKIN